MSGESKGGIPASKL